MLTFVTLVLCVSSFSTLKREADELLCDSLILCLLWQVRDRCRKEWTMFQSRVANAEKAYFKSIGVDPSNLTSH